MYGLLRYDQLKVKTEICFIKILFYCNMFIHSFVFVNLAWGSKLPTYGGAL